MFRTGLAVIGIIAGSSEAQVTTYRGLDFVSVGDAGNRAPLVSETRFGRGNVISGAVGYNYQIMETETTVADFAEFVTAYLPHHRAIPNESFFHAFRNLQNGPNNSLVPLPGRGNWGMDTTWIMAARFANWIHNDRSNDPEAFFGGAYDLSPERFTLNQDGDTLADISREPGALVALPTPDEWAKATYYDANRYGEGQGGYWFEPGSSNVNLLLGLPGSPGAETSRDIGAFAPEFTSGLPVLSYPQSRSPWGLADVSGGWEEALESSVSGLYGLVGRAGSSIDGGHSDLIDFTFRQGRAYSGGVAIRLVRIPAPGATMTLFVAGCISLKRRRLCGL